MSTDQNFNESELSVPYFSFTENVKHTFLCNMLNFKLTLMQNYLQSSRFVIVFLILKHFPFHDASFSIS